MSSIDDQIKDARLKLERLERIKNSIDFSFPQKIQINAYASKESLYSMGEKLGLTGDALRMFAHAQEYFIICSVDADGVVTPLMLKEQQ